MNLWAEREGAGAEHGSISGEGDGEKEGGCREGRGTYRFAKLEVNRFEEIFVAPRPAAIEGPALRVSNPARFGRGREKERT